MSTESSCVAPSRPQTVPASFPVSSSGLNGRRDESTTKSVRLRPKEHGAYAILAIPLVTSLFISGLTFTTMLVAAAAVAAFLAYEPLLIVAGSRGKRIRESTPAAVRVLTTRLMTAILCGAIAFWLGDLVVRLGLIVCIGFAIAEFVASVNGHSRRLATQLLGITGLTLPSTVILTAGGVASVTASQFWLIWVAGRMATTASVRSAITRHKSSVSIQDARILDILLIIAFAICGIGLFWGEAIWTATLPLVLAGAVLRVASPHPRHLKQIGWSLVLVNIASGIVMIGTWNH